MIRCTWEEGQYLHAWGAFAPLYSTVLYGETLSPEPSTAMYLHLRSLLFFSPLLPSPPTTAPRGRCGPGSAGVRRRLRPLFDAAALGNSFASTAPRAGDPCGGEIHDAADPAAVVPVVYRVAALCLAGQRRSARLSRPGDGDP